MTEKLLAFLTLVRRRHLAHQARSLISQTMVMMLLKTVDTSEFYFDKSISNQSYLRITKQTTINSEHISQHWHMLHAF